MGRILKAYRTRFHQLLRLAGARKLEQGVDWLVSRAKATSTERQISFSEALTLVFETLAAKRAFQQRGRSGTRTPEDLAFYCDAGLGGLARWLRAAGYQAFWEAGIPDDLLLKKARLANAAVLTTDSMLMERRVLRDRLIESFWLPPTLTIQQQLEAVFREFKLGVGSPRCMSCGGELERADKVTSRDRIPPKTYRWRDEYFICKRCGKLFWHGTHWLKIVERLKNLQSECSGARPMPKSDNAG